jgi:single-stranded DNA-binding protein
LQIEFKTLKPDQSFQTALTISGALSKEELIENIKEGKNNAMKFLSQVNRSVKSEQRNIQEEAFIKINLQKAVDCNE